MARMTLVGFMGAGKTTVGELLAAQTQLNLIDLDEKIVLDNGQQIPDIFETFGEAGFRQRETQALRDVLTQDVILSTGGGVVTQETNRLLLKRCPNPVVYLKADADVLYRRVQDDKNRPIAQSVDLKGFEALAMQREAYYQEVSDITVMTGDMTPMEVLDVILWEQTQLRA